MTYNIKATKKFKYKLLKQNIMNQVLKKYCRLAVRHLPILTPFARLGHTYLHNKEDFLLKSSSKVFNDIYTYNHWGSEKSKSGPGSTLEATISIRKKLPLLIERYSINSMLDVPCGDYLWMKEVEKKCHYIGGDIVAEMVENNQKKYSTDKIEFKQIDITKDVLPEVDLIFCKDCLQHLSYANVKVALNNFKRSNSKYLLVTSYPKTWRNHDIYDGDYRSLNLFIKPFSLPKPLLSIREKSKSIGVEIDKTMYLYDLKSIPFFDI
jgi:SAM-dependent methyltransferase